MQLTQQKLLYSGKSKSLFETNNADYVIAEFRDDATAFNGVKHEQLADKGVINCRINAHIMQELEKSGVPTHFVKMLSPTQIIARRLTMIPLEAVIRNVAAGSLCRRLGITEKSSLNPPLYELFLKNDALGDPLVTDNHALSFGWATQEQLDQMKQLTFKINRCLSEMLKKAGLLLVDAKFEFGVTAEGRMYLGDEISPDSCRIWDIETQKPLDKDRFRQDLGEVMESYQEIAQRLLSA